MPAAESVLAPIPWHEVQEHLRAGLSIQQAVDAMHIPEEYERVKRQATRKGWTRTLSPVGQLRDAEKQLERVRNEVVPNVPTPGQIRAEVGEKTRLSLAIGLQKGAAHIEQLDGESVLREAQNVASVVKSASAVHEWSQAAQGNVRISIYGGGKDQSSPVIDVDATVTPQSEE